jgi:hypothetical protein
MADTWKIVDITPQFYANVTIAGLNYAEYRRHTAVFWQVYQGGTWRYVDDPRGLEAAYLAYMETHQRSSTHEKS